MRFVSKGSAQPAVTQSEVYYYHTDHLNTPQLLTDKNQNIVWQASMQPFGQVDIQTEKVTNNLRFPGQYYDAETGKHYNYYRNCNPETGRYLQSDPSGYLGDDNSYAYAQANPLPLLIFMDFLVKN